ncbi:MAG: hypothetical protein IPM51_11825 [Sphingobacteriaceae bacterium]|nr:hypothetical protein [Sphingobacteriaceae bacterium]
MKKIIFALMATALFVGCEAINVKQVDLDKFENTKAKIAHALALKLNEDQVDQVKFEDTYLCQYFSNCPGGICYPNARANAFRANLGRVIRPAYPEIIVYPPVVNPPVAETIEAPLEEQSSEEPIKDGSVVVPSSSGTQCTNPNCTNPNCPCGPNCDCNAYSNSYQSYGSNGSYSGYSYPGTVTYSYQSNYGSTGSYSSAYNKPYGMTYSSNYSTPVRMRGQLVEGQPLRNVVRSLLFWR